MTTAKTRRSGTTAGSREGTLPKSASKASEAIPVLIRLPRLVTEPDEVCYAAEDEAEIRATIPLQTRVTDVAHSPPISDEIRTPADSKVIGKPAGAAFLLHPLTARTAPWLSFRFPRWTIRAGIAAGLIAVLVLAFSAIRGPASSSDKVADFDAADTLPVPGIPALETSPAPPSMLPRPSAAPAAPASAAPAAASPAAASPDAETLAPGAPIKNDLGTAKSAGGGSEGIPASSAVAPPPVNLDVPDTGEPQAPLPPLPKSPASTTDTAPADPASAIPAAAGPTIAAERNAAETAQAEANLPLIGQPAATAPADLQSYPATNPTTFQYPPDYHLRLPSPTGGPALGAGQTGTGGPFFNGPTANAAAANGWQPNTARLQPRIAPPPIR